MWRFSLTSSRSPRHRMGGPHLNSILTLSTWRQHPTPWVKGLSPTLTTPGHHTYTSFRCQSHAQAVTCASEQLAIHRGSPQPPPWASLTYQNSSQNSGKHFLTFTSLLKDMIGGFPGGAVVENPPTNAGDMGSSPSLGRSHMPRSS